METLQSVVLQSLYMPGDAALYVRHNERVLAELARLRLRFAAGGEATTDTYYSGLSVAAFKRTSPIRHLMLELAGSGEFIVTLGVHREGHATLWLCEHVVTLVPGQPVTLPVQGWERVQTGLLFARFRSVGEGVLERARYRTPDPPPHDVRLGLVITHFNRQAQVLPAIERIRREVLEQPEVAGRITLTVVDNSRNLPLQSSPVLRHLPNANYGGSGGFARGLLSLEDEGRATHALFMDDDASCEADCILRTFALLRYAASPKLAIAGALLNESEPWHLLEKGARFDGQCRPLSFGMDMRNVHELLWAENERQQPQYGGWWYFAFPIRAVTRYPFPFFVRGDDVLFGLTNHFEIRTFNGIACLAEEFRVKHGPMTAYLDARYHLLHLVVLREHGHARMLRRLFRDHFLRPLKSYQYASARAFTLALRHITLGPAFFRENLDMAAVRGEIGAWTPSEKMASVDRAGLRLRGERVSKEGRLRKLLRVVTLQGFLLPRALLIDRVQVHDKTFHGRASSTFRFRRVLYEHWQSDTGYIVEHDRRLAFAELRECIRALRAFWRALPELQRTYRTAFPQLASREFWRTVYGLPPRAVDEAAARSVPAATAQRPASNDPVEAQAPVRARPL